MTALEIPFLSFSFDRSTYAPGVPPEASFSLFFLSGGMGKYGIQPKAGQKKIPNCVYGVLRGT